MRHSRGQEAARSGGTAGHGGNATPAFTPGHSRAAADQCQAGQVPVSEDWLRVARLARLLSWLTLAWMGIEGGVAIAAAVVAGSVALLGFGLDSGIEAMASVIVIWQFTGTRLASPTAERRAQQLVAVSFFLLAPYIAALGAVLSPHFRFGLPPPTLHRLSS